MKKRLLSLLIVAVVLVAAPVALADHCKQCNPAGTLCRPAATGGKLNCDDTSGVCILSGACGGPHPFTEETFGAEFIVASVERLDEPQQPAASETRVAALETAPQQHAQR